MQFGVAGPPFQSILLYVKKWSGYSTHTSYQKERN